jgi:Abortive infection alpha
VSKALLEVIQDGLKADGLLSQIYGDLARPGAKQVGKALETVLGLGTTLLWPVAWANERTRLVLARNLERYRQRLEQVDVEQVVNVAPEIGVPIAEKFLYVSDSHLADLYTRLLAKASVQSCLDQAHPSFVNVIGNLSPDEAKLLEHLWRRPEVAFVHAKAVTKNRMSYETIEEIVVARALTDPLTFPENLAAYMSNLSGLGIVVVNRTEHLATPDAYAEVEREHTDRLRAKMRDDVTLSECHLTFDKGVIEVTSFGRKFLSSCHDPISQALETKR